MAVCDECSGPATEDDYCYGCASHICEECADEVSWSVADATMGTHEMSDHFEEADIE